MEPTDRNPIATALREAHEEIGLDPSFVEPLGYPTPTARGLAFASFPVVSLVREGFTLSSMTRQVADVFEVPLAFLMNADNHRTRRVPARAGAALYAMPFEQRYIWGATAGIMKNMHKRLFPA